jgi:purine-binding chemotaxis protein CheW
MNQQDNRTAPGGQRSTEAVRELIIFRVAELVCALDIARAQEIKGQLKIIEVPETALAVRGVANLRGQVITVIDLRIIFGIEPKDIDSESRIVVVRSDDGVVGLLVDYVDDIVPAEADDLEPPPANISGVRGEFFDAVFKRPGDLACLLNVERILRQEA